jgi:hypothetical protein
MRIFTLMMTALLFSSATFAQKNEPKKKIDLSNRVGDHFMMQVSSDHWLGAPDSIGSAIKPLSRGFNAALMLDKPFKNDPRFSVAFGLGVSTSHIFFDNTEAIINGNSNRLLFNQTDTVSHFQKYKMATTYAEVPLEIRYFSNPGQSGKAIKLALGVKVGTLINAHTKGKNLLDKNDQPISEFTQKINARSYFNSTRIAATFRAGYGNFFLFGSYNLTTVFKSQVASEISLLQAGIGITGL